MGVNIWCRHGSNVVVFRSTNKVESKRGDTAEFERTAANVLSVNKHLVKGEWNVKRFSKYSDRKTQRKKTI